MRSYSRYPVIIHSNRYNKINLFAFSMYGFLDVHADTQYVRVMPILDELLPNHLDTIDHSVTITP